MKNLLFDYLYNTIHLHAYKKLTASQLNVPHKTKNTPRLHVCLRAHLIFRLFITAYLWPPYV